MTPITNGQHFQYVTEKKKRKKKKKTQKHLHLQPMAKWDDNVCCKWIVLTDSWIFIL